MGESPESIDKKLGSNTRLGGRGGSLPGYRPSMKVPSRVMAQREKMYLQMRSMNPKGRAI